MSAALRFLPEAERVLALACSRGAMEAEAFFQHGVELRARAFDGALEELTSAEARGIGLRVFGGGRVGFASTSDLSDAGLRQLAGMASQAQAHVDPDEFARLPDGTVGSGPASAEFAQPCPMTERERALLALELERRAVSCRPDARRTSGAVYGDERVHTELHSTRGVHAAFEATVAYASVEVIAERDGEVQSGFGAAFGRSPADLDLALCAKEAAERATALLGARRLASGTYPAAIENRAWAALLGTIVPALTAEAVQGNRSPLAGRLGHPVGRLGLSLVDDAGLEGGLGSRPWDDEGVPSQRTVVIDGGVLRGFLHSSYTARRGGVTASTGNASRTSYRSAPEVGATNLLFGAGDDPLEGLLDRMGDGILVTDLYGLHTVDPVSGDFALGISGFAVRHGRRAWPVHQATIAGNLIAVLDAIEAVGADLRFGYDTAFIGAPSILVGALAVSSD